MGAALEATDHLPEPARAAGSTARLRLGGRAYLWLACGLLPIAFAPPDDALLSTVAFDLLLVCLFVFDALRLRAASLALRRVLAPRLRVGVAAPYTLALKHAGPPSLRVRVRDALSDLLRMEQVPEGMGSDDRPLTLTAGEQRTLRGTVLPLARGRTLLPRVALRVESWLGLAALHLEAGEPQEVRVLPALGLDAEAQRARRDELGSVAQRLKRAPQGSELESLREYVHQDPLRAIDWKATARRRRPVTRLYQPERSQTVWLVLDASRTMAQDLGARPAPAQDPRAALRKTRFDVAVEAALALADAALSAGDQVGLLVHADRRLRLDPPGRGRRHFLRLVDALTELHAEPVQLAVRSLLTTMEREARKRALVVLFTDLENEVHGAAVCEHAPLLTRRHLTVCVSLQDVLIREGTLRVPRDPAQVFHKAAAIDLANERERLQRTLEKRGITVLEADVRGLVPKLLAHYLKVKLAARL